MEEVKRANAKDASLLFGVYPSLDFKPFCFFFWSFPWCTKLLLHLAHKISM